MHVALQPHRRDQLARLLTLRSFQLLRAHHGCEECGRQPSLLGQHHRLQHRHGGKQPGVLERPDQPLAGAHEGRHVELPPQATEDQRAGEPLAVEADAAAVRMREASDQLEERGLTGAVGPDEPEDLALVHLQADAVHCLDAAVGLRDLLEQLARPQGAKLGGGSRQRRPELREATGLPVRRRQ